MTSRNISADGSDISGDVKHRKCSTSWNNGSDVDFGRWSGTSGNEEPRDIENSASAASLRRTPRKRRGDPKEPGPLPKHPRHNTLITTAISAPPDTPHSPPPRSTTHP